MVPDGMTSHVHAFDAREGGTFRISLMYDAPEGKGKTDPHTDTYHGRFVTLVQDERAVQVVEFETPDPAMQGEMTISITLADAGGGTQLVAVHVHLPPGLSPANNETGWRMSLGKLAKMVERAQCRVTLEPEVALRTGEPPVDRPAGSRRAFLPSARAVFSVLTGEVRAHVERWPLAGRSTGGSPVRNPPP
jgi:uncharacterized protein YndB with AHSA1/START domain